MTVVNAASLSQADVQAAITSSASGDTIVMPAGSATWSSLLSGSSGIGGLSGRTLQGGGSGATIITEACGATNGFGVILIGTGTTLTGFTLQSADVGFSQDLIVGNSATGVKMYDVTLDNIIRRGLAFYSTTNGVHSTAAIWNCLFRAKSYPDVGDGAFQLVAVNGPDNPNSSTPPAQSTGAGSWAYDPGQGGTGMIVIEESTFYQDAQGDSTVETYDGGKIAIRRCYGTNFELGVHGRDSSVRSGHSVELYQNVFVNNIGTDHIGTVTSRGGTGVVWGNVITQTNTHGSQTSSNVVTLQVFRAAGNLDADPAQRFPYSGGQLDGHSPYDGNAAIISGTHTGSNGATTLTDGSKAWTTNQLQGLGNYNLTDTLQSYFLWNLTTGAGARVSANTATTATAALAGGTRQTWNAGDSYILTYGYSGLDQNGRSGPTAITGVQSSQALNPWYTWNNTFNGTPNQLPFVLSYMDAAHTDEAQPDSSYFVQENREYYNNVQKPGYSPLFYPHPWRNTTQRGLSGSASTSGKVTIQ